MFELNPNVKQRDEIIFGAYEPKKYLGGIRKFEGLRLETLKELSDLGHLNLFDAQNDGPTIQKFMDFMEKYPGYKAMGYVVSKDRGDYRLTVDGIEKVESHISMAELEDFLKEFGDTAEDITATTNCVSCWYD